MTTMPTPTSNLIHPPNIVISTQIKTPQSHIPITFSGILELPFLPAVAALSVWFSNLRQSA